MSDISTDLTPIDKEFSNKYARLKIDFEELRSSYEGLQQLSKQQEQLASQQQQLIHQLEEEKARLKKLVDHIPVGVILADSKGDFLIANREAENLLRGKLTVEPYGEKEPIDLQYIDGRTIPLSDLPHMRAQQKKEIIRDFEMVVRCDVGKFIFLVYATPIEEENGDVCESVVAFENITARKQHEVEQVRLMDERRRHHDLMHREGAFLRKIIDTTPAMVFVKDIKGKFILVNQALARVYGKSVEEIVGNTDADFDSNVDEVEHFHMDDQFVIRSQTEMIIPEEKVTHADGTVHWYRTIKVPLINDDGTCDRLLGVATNITDLRDAKWSLELYADKLEQSNQDLERFAFLASHDIQEPLRKIKMFSERVVSRAGDQIDEETHLFLERMHDASIRMQTMVNGLLDLSRVNTHGLPFVVVDLRQTVNDVIFDLESQMEEADCEVVVGDLPEIMADPMQMHELFQNIIGNALKYKKNDAPCKVSISAKTSSENGDREAAITIEDNGIGFNEKDVDKIFRPFERLVGHSEYEGSGMGLAICKKIVERHGGTITAHSVPGEGSTFNIVLPL